MDTKYTEIECLKLEIEKRMGKPLKSPTDFNQTFAETTKGTERRD